jgi:hypothetical protein
MATAESELSLATWIAVPTAPVARSTGVSVAVSASAT